MSNVFLLQGISKIMPGEPPSETLRFLDSSTNKATARSPDAVTYTSTVRCSDGPCEQDEGAYAVRPATTAASSSTPTIRNRMPGPATSGSAAARKRCTRGEVEGDDVAGDIRIKRALQCNVTVQYCLRSQRLACESAG